MNLIPPIAWYAAEHCVSRDSIDWRQVAFRPRPGLVMNPIRHPGIYRAYKFLCLIFLFAFFCQLPVAEPSRLLSHHSGPALSP